MQGESTFCGTHLTVGAFTPEKADLLITAMRAGNQTASAARAVGITARTLQLWIKRGRQGRPPYAEFVERVDRARAEGEVRQVSLIANAASDDWRAATYLLDRRLRDEDPPAPLDTRELADRAAEMARNEAISALEALGEPVEHSMGAVERYATAVSAWRALEAQWEHLGRPGTAPGGATGTVPVAHPLVTQIAVARKEASTLGGLLGLDPLGRWKLARRISGQGRPAGAASAPDRVGVDPPRRRLRSVN